MECLPSRVWNLMMAQRWNMLVLHFLFLLYRIVTLDINTSKMSARLKIHYFLVNVSGLLNVNIIFENKLCIFRGLTAVCRDVASFTRLCTDISFTRKQTGTSKVDLTNHRYRTRSRHVPTYTFTDLRLAFLNLDRVGYSMLSIFEQ